MHTTHLLMPALMEQAFPWWQLSSICFLRPARHLLFFKGKGRRAGVGCTDETRYVSVGFCDPLPELFCFCSLGAVAIKSAAGLPKPAVSGFAHYTFMF